MNIKQLLAQAYCTKRNKHKMLDDALLEDMEKIILKAINRLPKYFYDNCKGVVKNKRIGRFVLVDDFIKEGKRGCKNDEKF